MGYSDLAAAVVKQAVQDYVEARTYLVRKKAPPNIDAVYKDVKSQYDEARASGRIGEVRKLGDQLSKLEAMKRKAETCAELESFFLSEECSSFYEIDGRTLLRRIKEMVA